jgi:hypothetical protein
MLPLHKYKESAMRTHRFLIIAMILLFVVGTVPSLIARSKPSIEAVTWPDDGSGDNILEGDPWDDNNDDGPGGVATNDGISQRFKIYQMSIFRFIFISFDQHPVGKTEVKQVVGLKKSNIKQGK